MFGTVIGDIAGSRFEFSRNRAEEGFELFAPRCCYTDDTVLTAAVCLALMESEPGDDAGLKRNVRLRLQEFGRMYPYAGYGGAFIEWIDSLGLPYNSFGNGAGMRVAPVAWVASSVDEVLHLADIVTGVTHNHPEGLKGGRAVALSAYLARKGEKKETIRREIRQRFYPLDFTLEEIRETYQPSVTCQGSVPQAIEAFLEADSFESAVRSAIMLGGDTDTLAAMSGSMAEAYYGVPAELKRRALDYLDSRLAETLLAFEEKYQK